MTVVMTAVFTLLIGTVVDISRLQAARSQIQAAADAALMGGVATAGTVDVQQEAQRLFSANFQPGSMGVVVTPVNVQFTTPDTYTLSVSATVLTLMMKYFDADIITFTATPKVTRGFAYVAQVAEVSLVFANTASMAGGSKMSDLKNAARRFADVMFGSSQALSRVSFNLVPFDAGVNIGAVAAQRTARRNWMQPAWQSAFDTHGIAANRNSDHPPNTLNDISDAAPLAANTAFRTPNPAADAADVASASLAPLVFGMQGKQALYDAINAMQPAGEVRTNVGVLWGWMTLSPNWQGLWDAGLPDLPRSVPSSKTLVLVTDSKNNIYKGGSKSDDDATTLQLCTAMKAQGMAIYTVGFGSPGQVNQNMLRDCATAPTYYFHAPDAASLTTALRAIADRLLYQTIRIEE